MRRDHLNVAGRHASNAVRLLRLLATTGPECNCPANVELRGRGEHAIPRAARLNVATTSFGHSQRRVNETAGAISSPDWAEPPASGLGQ